MSGFSHDDTGSGETCLDDAGARRVQFETERGDSSEFASWREAKDHRLIADLLPPDYGVTRDVWAARRVTKRCRWNIAPPMFDPHFIVGARCTPI
jgi:hypothetical protein